MFFTHEFLLPIFEILDATQGVEQKEDYHPEGDVYTHSIQCCWWAFREIVDTDLILAALCHDFGKAIELNGHAKWSVKLMEPHLSTKSLWLIENHMKIRDLFNGKIRKVKKVSTLLDHPWLSDLVHLTRFDKLGRDPNPQKANLLTKGDIIDKLNWSVEAGFLANKSYASRPMEINSRRRL